MATTEHNARPDGRPAVAPYALISDLDPLRHRWGGLLALGIALMVLGIIALAFIPATTIGVVVVLGWLIIVSGIVEGIYTFHVRRWSGVFLHLAGSVLGVLLGLLIITHPASGALALTMLLAAYLTVIGLFRAITAIQLRYRLWRWTVLDGIVTLVLGLLLWAAWPSSGLWFPGFAVGIALLLRGWTTAVFAIALRAVGRGAPPRENL